MSRLPIRASADLQRLVDEGYELSIVRGHLVIADVPYVDASKRVRRGRLISRLDLAGDRTVAPRDHMAWFAGAAPCDRSGRMLKEMVHVNMAGVDLGDGQKAEWLLCSKPLDGEYADHYEKMVTFIRQIASHAEAIDPAATARTGKVVADDLGRSPFHYLDTATARSGIATLSERLSHQSIGIIGLGGTGGYVLDLVSKSPVKSIHVFDDDDFLQHNAFRAPGAASVEDLASRRSKTDHFDRIYSRMHRGVVPHRTAMGPSTYAMLDGLDFVFICTDGTAQKRGLIHHLEDRGVSFVDVGMGLNVTERGIGGSVRVTTSTIDLRDHVWTRSRIPLSGEGADEVYATNVQVAELNALSASLAVIRWKRLLAFYRDDEREHFSIYSVEGNNLINEELALVDQ